MDKQHKLLDKYKENLTYGVVDTIGGNNISKTYDNLSKKMIRIKEEQSIKSNVMMTEK